MGVEIGDAFSPDLTGIVVQRVDAVSLSRPPASVCTSMQSRE